MKNKILQTRDELRCTPYGVDRKEVHGEDFPCEPFRVLKEKEIKQFGGALCRMSGLFPSGVVLHRSRTGERIVVSQAELIGILGRSAGDIGNNK